MSKASIHAERGIYYAPTVPKGSLFDKLLNRNTPKENPLYVVEIYQEEGYSLAVVFKAELINKEVVKKRKQQEVKSNKPVIKGQTELSRIARAMFPEEKPKTRYVEDAPLFTAAIVEGTDTFTGKFGLGFYEREPGKEIATNRGRIMQDGSPTGVFITLESIKIVSRFVPLKEALNFYKKQEETKIFNLQRGLE